MGPSRATHDHEGARYRGGRVKNRRLCGAHQQSCCTADVAQMPVKYSGPKMGE